MKTKAAEALFFILFICTIINSYAAADEAKHVILMETMPVKAVEKSSEWFQHQIKELNYENGKNINLVILKANGDRRLAEKLLAEELAKGDPDLVVTVATLASQTALKLLKPRNIPLLFFQVSDPVGAGLIKHINAPSNTNVTGRIATVNREAKIEMILRLVGQMPIKKPIRFGFIHSTYPSSKGDIRELKKIAEKHDNIIFVPFEIPYKNLPQGLPFMLEQTKKAVKELENRVDFWVEPSGPLGETLEYTNILINHSKIPIALGIKLDSVKMGALLHVTPSIESTGREAAILADLILKGKDPGQIPVVPPSKFDMGINLKTALKLNIVIPPDMLRMAEDNIYR